MQTFKIEAQVVSPLHIGTGEVYEPTEFFIDPSRRELCIIDFEKFCAHFSASELQKFKKICFAGTLQSLLNLYAFVDQTCLNFLNQGLRDFIVRRIELCEWFLEHYRRMQSLTGKQLEKEFNKFTIYRTAFSPNDNQPIIPGSSVKGALRTAVLNKRRSKARGESYRDYCQGRRCDSKRLESEILEYPRYRFQQDPFRLIKVSDFRPKGPVKTRIIYTVNRKKDGTSACGPYQILEVIEPGAIFEGEITIQKAFPLSDLRNPQRDGIKNPLSWEEIIEAAKVFYGVERDREFEDLSQMGASVPLFPEEGTPLRVGRH
ncbi:type III-A CRISPR-associated RAMP protein Csm5, partial [Thermodesulfatator atlanticus]